MINQSNKKSKDKKQSIESKTTATKIVAAPNPKPKNTLQEPLKRSITDISINLKDQIDNLQSIYNNMALINQRIDNTFNNQKEYSERKLHDKLLQIIELKENNFKLFSKVNSMVNINIIDEYFNTCYPRIVQICPKAENVIESMNDLTSNINYGIDRFYLDNNLICDENALRNTLQFTTREIEELNMRLNVKNKQISDMKDNYTQLLSLISNEKEKCDRVKKEIDKYRSICLSNNINSIYQELIVNNKFLISDIIDDE